MADLPELPLNGYYRSSDSTYVGSYLFLRLYPDGYWLFEDSNDEDFDFPAYEAARDPVALRHRFPQGHCLPTNEGGWWYRFGRYTRQANVPISYGLYRERVIPGKLLADALVLTSWTELLGDYWFWQAEVIGPGLLKPTPWEVVCEFVPDNPAHQP